MIQNTSEHYRELNSNSTFPEEYIGAKIIFKHKIPKYFSLGHALRTSSPERLYADHRFKNIYFFPDDGKYYYSIYKVEENSDVSATTLRGRYKSTAEKYSEYIKLPIRDFTLEEIIALDMEYD